VTGASGGIGQGIALALAREGVDVAVNYKGNKEGAAGTIKEIRAMGRQALLVRCDVSVYEEVVGMREAVDEGIGGIDILVNNAGINRDNFFIKMSHEQWDEVIRTNLNGMFNCTKVFMEEIVATKRGRVVNISSVVGQQGNIGQANYAAAKAGMIGFTKSLAREMATTGVTVNAIAPGFIETPMLAKVPDKVRERLVSQIPMRRFGTIDEVAAAVVYLCSDEAGYITGAVLEVNGGLHV
jgi:3-oxoacyl-[acyl-carrier protein] reductase